MATVTGLTATRMLAIEAASVIGGAVDAGTGHLILTKHDGSTIDAGYIVDRSSIVDLVSNQTVDGLKTFSKLVTITPAAAGTSLSLTKGAATFQGGSIVVGRAITTNPQSISFQGNFATYSMSIGRAGSSDDISIQRWDGATLSEVARIQTDGLEIISRPTAGISLQVTKESAALTNTSGSVVIGRSAIATPQSLLFSGGTTYNFHISRNASSDHLSFQTHDGATLSEKARIQTDGGILAVGTDHNIGPNAFGGTGARLHINVDTAQSTVLSAEASGANSALTITTKGTGGFGYNNAGVQIWYVSPGQFQAAVPDLYLGPNAFSATGIRDHISFPGGSTITYTAEGSATDIYRNWLQKGAGHFTFKTGGGASLVDIDSTGAVAVIGTNNFFGAGALGAAGTYINIGSLGDANNAYVTANGSVANVGLVLRPKGTSQLQLADSASTTVIAIAAANKLGFFGSTPVAKPAVTGSKGANAALTSLLTQLAALGLITDSST